MENPTNPSIVMEDFDNFFRDTLMKVLKAVEVTKRVSGDEAESIVSVEELSRLSLIQDYRVARQSCSDQAFSLIRKLGHFVSSDVQIPQSNAEFDNNLLFDAIQDISELCLEDVELFLSAKNANQGQSRSTNKFEAGDDKFNTMLASTRLDIDKPQLCFSPQVDNSRQNSYSSSNDLSSSSTPPVVSSSLLDLAQSPSSYRELNISWVDDEKQLGYMIAQINELCMLNGGYCEIGVDIEHHSVLSFQGFICLIQISTRYEDFLIDAIKLRCNINNKWEPALILAFKGIFENSNILKIFHGSSQDVVWLQRDFGIHVSSLFDTFLAAKYIKKTTKTMFDSLSLSSLVKKLVSNFRISYIETKPIFQLADWRIRPLTDDQLTYASFDSFYLLEIFDRMAGIIGSEGVRQVIGDSWKVACTRYQSPQFDPIGYKILNSSHYEASSSSVYRTINADTICRIIWNWRDEMARKYDVHLAVVISPTFFSRLLKSPSSISEPCLVSLLRLCTDVSVDVMMAELEACLSQTMTLFSPIPSLIDGLDLQQLCKTLLRRKQVTASDKRIVTNLSSQSRFFARLTQIEPENSQPTVHSFTAMALDQPHQSVAYTSSRSMQIVSEEEEEACKVFSMSSPIKKHVHSPKLLDSVRKIEADLKRNLQKRDDSSSLTSQFPSSVQEIYDTSKRKRTAASYPLANSITSIATSTESIPNTAQQDTVHTSDEITDDNETVTGFLKQVKWLPNNASADVNVLIDGYVGKPVPMAQISSSNYSSNAYTKKNKSKLNNKW